MILVDTNIWIEHFEKNILELREIAFHETLCCHPLIISEIACGHSPSLGDIIETLSLLPQLPQASLIDFLTFIKTAHLSGRGLGCIDIHLLWSTKISNSTLWTKDQKLLREARRLKISYA